MSENWYPDTDLTTLTKLATEAAGKVDGDFLEIGVWRGHTARHLCAIAKTNPNKSCKQERLVFCIDPWQASQKCWEEAERAYCEWKANSPANAITFRLRGEVFLEADRGPPYACIHIDADHERETTELQIRRAWKKLAPGGLLIGHDFVHFPVAEAVRAVFGDDFEVKGTVWYKWRVADGSKQDHRESAEAG